LEDTFKDIYTSNKFFVISIVGPQNGGKSTLLNFLFGCDFSVNDGRCTKGVYGTIIQSVIPGFDYILVIDSEGL
jgi:GTP-binding protein EngB required for normal cell division